jgi:hypothetical protein
MGTSGAARALARQIGDALRAHFPGWRAAVLMPEAGWARLLGLTGAPVPLINGGLRVFLAVGEVRAPAGAGDRRGGERSA